MSSPGGDLGVSHRLRLVCKAEVSLHTQVVIPWRGFRCFTLNYEMLVGTHIPEL